MRPWAAGALSGVKGRWGVAIGRSLLPGVLAGAAGALWGVQFGPEPFLLAPWVALVPLVFLLGHPWAPVLGFLHGLATWLVALPWIVFTLEAYGDLPRPLAVLLLLLLASYLAAFHGVFAWLGGPLWRRGILIPLWALPALWVALEWLRTHLFSGFPWNLAAYAWVEVPGALPVSAWIGAYGVSSLVLLANTAGALTLRWRRWEVLALGWLAALLVLGMGGRWGEGRPVETSGQLPVRIVQPNTPILSAAEEEEIRRSYRRIFSLSHAACDHPGALLVWPESAAWPSSLSLDPAFRQDLEILARRGCPVLLNSVHPVGEGYYNSAFLLTPGGELQRYDKRHLVPFGEYVPLGRFIPFLRALARNAGDFTPARDLRLLAWEGEEMGVAICFEIIFPGEVAAMVRRGATLLVTLTNDAWFGDSAAPWQHFRAVRFRAAENRRPLLRAALTGVSALIGPDGSVQGLLGVGEEGIIRGLVVGRRDPSPYGQAPWLVPLVFVLAALFAIVKTYRS